MASVIDVSGKQFDQEVLKSKQPVLVNFYVSREPHVPFKARTLQRLADEFAGRIKFVSVDLADEVALDVRYRNGHGLPIRLFHRGQELATFELFRAFDEFRAVLEFILADGIARKTRT